MLRWSLLGMGMAWAAGMLYEWLWTGGQSPWMLFSLAAGVFVGGALFVWQGGRQLRVQPMVWFVLAALTVAFCQAALERAVARGLTHVTLLPMYPILFLDFLASGCYTWWKKRR